MPETELCFFAHAGGSARSFTGFRKYLDSSIIPVPVELAGRGSRLSEARYTDPEKCAGDVFLKNREIFERGNYAFFGHSLGTVISFEVARIIKKCGLPSPKHIFFSGRPAPYSDSILRLSGIAEASDADFIKAFSVYGGLPDIIVNDPEMLSMVLPILRDDVRMADRYRPVLNLPEFECDISVFYGNSDPVYSGGDPDVWEKCTTGKCSLTGFDGNHFYFNNPDNRKKLCDYINSVLVSKE